MSTQSIYAERRQRIFDAMPPRSLAIFPSAPVRQRNSDVDHEYRQDSDLYFLTGFPEPESVALLSKDGDQHQFELLVRPRDKEREIWDGKRAGVDGALDDFGADVSKPISEIEGSLKAAATGKDILIYALGAHVEMDQRIVSLLDFFRRSRRKIKAGPRELHDPAALVHEMRLVKDHASIENLQRACDITVHAHEAAMRAAKPGMNERQIQAILEGTFRILGSARNGYPCIVAGGANATILHYNENDQPLRDGDLLLIDAGAEYGYFTSDVTRTYPVNGRFSPAQREVYEVVLRAQLASIEATRAGQSFDHVHEISVRVLTEGLVELGLLQGDVDTLIAEEGYKRYYMHRTGHWIGMDVHDVGAYWDGDDSRVLEPGMVLTVEPGLYIAPDDDQADERYRGIGIRIEDDVLVTDGDPRVLTGACAKTVEAVEAVMAQQAPEFPAL